MGSSGRREGEWRGQKKVHMVDILYMLCENRIIKAVEIALCREGMERRENGGEGEPEQDTL
jgi:hypothetical protein